MHANGDIERGYPPVLPLASLGALVGATPLLVTGTTTYSYCSSYSAFFIFARPFGRVRTQSLEPGYPYDAAGRERSQYHEVCWGRIAAGSHVRPGVKLRVAAYDRLSNRENLGMDQVFVVWTSKSGLNQPTVV